MMPRSIILPYRPYRVNCSRKVAEQWNLLMRRGPIDDIAAALADQIARELDREALLSLGHGKRKIKTHPAAHSAPDRNDRPRAAFAAKRVPQRKAVPRAPQA